MSLFIKIVKASEEDKPEERCKAIKLGSLEGSSAKACDQVQNELIMSDKANKELVEDVRGSNMPLYSTIVERSNGDELGRATGELFEDVHKENMPSETAERSKEAKLRSAAIELAEEIHRKNMPLETTIVEESKEAKPKGDIATMEIPPMGKFDLSPLYLFEDQEGPRRDKPKLLGEGSYEGNVPRGVLDHDNTWRRRSKQAVPLGGQPSPSRVLLMGEQFLWGNNQARVRVWSKPRHRGLPR
ncbi:hypothetical protein V6N13_104414 [Hibiscus sabdariffa]